MAVTTLQPTLVQYGDANVTDLAAAQAVNAGIANANAPLVYADTHPPTASDDYVDTGGHGKFSKGSTWIENDTTQSRRRIYKCMNDNSSGAAIWQCVMDFPLYDRYNATHPHVPDPVIAAHPMEPTLVQTLEAPNLETQAPAIQEGVQCVKSAVVKEARRGYDWWPEGSGGKPWYLLKEFGGVGHDAVLCWHDDGENSKWVIIEDHSRPEDPGYSDSVWAGPSTTSPVGTYTIGQTTCTIEPTFLRALSLDGADYTKITYLDAKTQQQWASQLQNQQGEFIDNLAGVSLDLGQDIKLEDIQNQATLYLEAAAGEATAKNFKKVYKGQYTPQLLDTDVDLCLFWSDSDEWRLIEGTEPSETADYSTQTTPDAGNPAGAYTGDAGAFTFSWYRELDGTTECEDLAVTGDLNVTGDAESAAFKYLDATTGGTNVTLVGVNAGGSRSGAVSYNTCIGNGAGKNLTYTASVEGRCNAFLGNDAGRGGTTNKGTYNAAMGYQSLYSVTTGCNNVCFGAYAGLYLTTGNNNTLFGRGAGVNLTSGGDNLFLGNNAGYRQTTNAGLLIIDNQDRSSTANEQAYSMFYGTFNSSLASQNLRINVGAFAFNGTPVSLPITAGAATATSTWTTTEQTMLQKAYDALRSIGVLS